MFLEPEDLAPFATVDEAKADAMIEDAEAQAVLVAPCIADLLFDDPRFAVVKAILRRAVLRWNEVGAGGLSSKQQMAGPFSQMEVVGTRAPKGNLFWPEELSELQGICSDDAGRAFTISTAPVGAGAKDPQDGVWTTPTAWVPGP